jgi:hypothetical protein
MNTLWLEPEFCNVAKAQATIQDIMNQGFCEYFWHDPTGVVSSDKVDCTELKVKFEANYKDGYISPYCWYFNVHASAEGFKLDPEYCIVPTTYENYCLQIVHKKDGAVQTYEYKCKDLIEMVAQLGIQIDPNCEYFDTIEYEEDGKYEISPDYCRVGSEEAEPEPCGYTFHGKDGRIGVNF